MQQRSGQQFSIGYTTIVSENCRNRERMIDVR